MADQNDREEARQQRFPFDGLHVYQRTQEAWSVARETLGTDPLEVAIEEEIRSAALGIARATARSRENGGFAAELEHARGSLHAAAAIVEQLERHEVRIEERLGSLLVDSARMLGALIRSVTRDAIDVESEVAA